nr:hypothetical protein [uncultured Desulfobulbus sp.]
MENECFNGEQLVSCIVGCLVWGCAGPQRWTNPGITEPGLAADIVFCRRQAKKHAPFWGQSNELERLDRREVQVQSCVEQRGYRLVQ